MAQFKVGQRVRIVRSANGHEGREATITAIPNPFGGRSTDCRVLIDGGPCGSSQALDYTWSTDFWCIAPLLPPDSAADQFIARMKRLGSEPVNDAPKVKVEAK